MATTDTKKDEKIPDTYTIPQWFRDRCGRETLSAADELIFETVKAETPTAESESKDGEEPSSADSAATPSSGRSSVVIVDAEQPSESQAQPGANQVESIHSDQADSQTTIKADEAPIEAQKEDKSHSEPATDSAPALVQHKIKETTYTAIKDTFAPALISNHHLLAFEHPSSIALSVKTAKELPLADAVVARLAKDFNARTILLDAEDIEDLAWEFDKQQKGFDKIDKDKKTAKKEKEKAEKEKQRLEREEKKAKRAAKKAEKEKKKAAEAEKAKTDAGKTEAKAEPAAISNEKTAASEDTADSSEEKPAEVSMPATSGSSQDKDKTASSTATPAESAGDANAVSTTEEAPKTVAGDTHPNGTPKTEDATTNKLDSDSPANAKKADVQSDKKDDAAVPKDESAKVDEVKKDDSSAEKKDGTATTDETADKKEDEAKGDESAEKKKEDEDSDSDDKSDAEEEETPDSTSDSENDDCCNNDDTYWDPCKPKTIDTGYDMTKLYLTTRGHQDRSRKLYKRSKNALLSLLRGPEPEKPVEVKAESIDNGRPTAKSDLPASVDDASSTSKPAEQVTERPEQSSPDAQVEPAEKSTDTVISADTSAVKADSSEEKTETKDEKPDTSEPAPSLDPLLICIRDVNTIMESDGGKDALGRIADLIPILRETNQRAILVVTLADKQSPFKDDACPCGYPFCCNTPKKLEKMLKRLKIDQSAKIDLSPPIGKSKDEKKEETEDEPEDETKLKREYINTRRLKRYLRHGVPESLSQKWFDASEAWAHDTEGRLVKIAEKTWDDIKVRRAARQIIGRGVALDNFDFDDVLHVIDHLERQEQKSEEDEKEKSEAAKAFEKKLEKVKADCNTHEERLLESIVKPSALETSYGDVIIDNDTKDAVKQLITLFKFKATSKSKKLLKLLNISGAMFYGPPGTGKTHLCRAMANDYGACMLALEASTLMDMWVGETEKLIKAAFTLATKLHPCILFIDEADSLFRKRTSCDKSWERNALTMYLQQMDGIGTDSKRPFVVVATNRPSDLDDAFLRRLPHKVLFSLPSEPHRAEILKLFVEKEDLDESVDLLDIAKQARGLSGSDLKSLCGQAVLAWATQKAITESSTDEQLTSELKLTSEHFKIALKRTRPTVSRQALSDVDSFARQFDSARF